MSDPTLTALDSHERSGQEGMAEHRFLTIKQVTDAHPGISERTLRHWIFGAKERRKWVRGQAEVIPGNGFDRVLRRKGTKILIDEIALLDWLQS